MSAINPAEAAATIGAIHSVDRATPANIPPGKEIASNPDPAIKAGLAIGKMDADMRTIQASADEDRAANERLTKGYPDAKDNTELINLTEQKNLADRQKRYLEELVPDEDVWLTRKAALVEHGIRAGVMEEKGITNEQLWEIKKNDPEKARKIVDEIKGEVEARLGALGDLFVQSYDDSRSEPGGRLGFMRKGVDRAKAVRETNALNAQVSNLAEKGQRQNIKEGGVYELAGEVVRDVLAQFTRAQANLMRQGDDNNHLRIRTDYGLVEQIALSHRGHQLSFSGDKFVDEYSMRLESRPIPGLNGSNTTGQLQPHTMEFAANLGSDKISGLDKGKYTVKLVRGKGDGNPWTLEEGEVIVIDGDSSETHRLSPQARKQVIFYVISNIGRLSTRPQ